MPMNGLKLSPVGGNFIGLDGDHVTTGGINYQGSISQTLNNLHKGLDYDVSFYWATAQQVAYNGATMEQLRVSLCGPGGNPGTSAPFGPGNSHAGSCGFFTDIVSTPNHGFKGWFHEAPVQFKATAIKETLEFLALGTPNALPPYALLDGVDVTPVPEPATWSLFGIGFAVIAGLAYRRHKSVSVD
jgi:hypothetical protein